MAYLHTQFIIKYGHYHFSQVCDSINDSHNCKNRIVFVKNVSRLTRGLFCDIPWHPYINVEIMPKKFFLKKCEIHQTFLKLPHVLNPPFLSNIFPWDVNT
jgi:hypothetical protein